MERFISTYYGIFVEESLTMRTKRHLRNSRPNRARQPALCAEQLEKRELLAADFVCTGVPIGPGGNRGVCQVESELVDVDNVGTRANALGNMQRNGGNGRGMGAGRGGMLRVDPAQAGDVTVDGQLSDADATGVKYLREEEKLARDVYLTLGDIWGAPIFAKIAQAESRHMAAVGQLIDNYGLDDPVGENGRGVFEDPVLANLYDQLVAAGSKSLQDAYKVGAMIEELDIHDLRAASAENADVERVYEVLERGSRNHLRAFDARIEAGGNEYTATYLSQAEYDAIADSAVERGNGPGGQGQPGRGRAGGQIGDIGESLHRRDRTDVGRAGRRAQGGDGGCEGEPDRDRDRTSPGGDVDDTPQQAAVRDRLFANWGFQRGNRRF
jgi:hypothetical protein